MKKYRLLLLSLLLLLVSFTVAWYTDPLFDALFLFLFPLYLLLFVCFIVLAVESIKGLVKRRETPCLASLAVLLLLFVLITQFPFREAKAKTELELFEEKRLEVVDMIRNDRLQPRDELGNIVLPVGYRWLSTSGEVFQYQNDETGQVISFWVFRGMLSGSVELVYSSGGEELIRAHENRIGPITRIEKLKDCWFYIVTD